MQMNKLKQLTTRLLLVAAISILCSILTAAQENPTGAKPEQNGAKITNQTPNAASDLAECSQMLDQSLAEVRACKDLAEDRLDQIMKRDELLELDQKEITRLKSMLDTAEKLIQRLEKQCSTTSFLFGLIKIKRC